MKSIISGPTSLAHFFFNSRDRRICRSGGASSNPPAKSPAARIDTNRVLAEARNTLKFYLVLATDLETPPPHIIERLNNCYDGLGLEDLFKAGWLVVNATIRSGNLTRPLKTMGEIALQLPTLPTAEERDTQRGKLIVAYLACKMAGAAGQLARETEALDRRFAAITELIAPQILYTDDHPLAFDLLTNDATVIARMSSPAQRIERFSIIAKLLAEITTDPKDVDIILQELSGDLVSNTQKPSQAEIDRLNASIAKRWSAFPVTRYAHRLENWLTRK